MKFRDENKKNIYYFFIIIILTSIDILLKYLFKGNTFLITQNFGIVYVLNKGSAFSLFSNFYYYNKIIILISLIVLYYVIRYKNKISFILQILLLSGIFSNLYDRIFFQGVRDYLLTPFFTFNLADFYLTLAGIIIVYEYFTKKTIFE